MKNNPDEKESSSCDACGCSKESQDEQFPPEQKESKSPSWEEQLKKSKDEAAEHKDKYLRQLAESENMRKRLQKEKHENAQYAVRRLIVEFLHPIDHMENALKYTENTSDEVKHWSLGFQMILTQFKDVLTHHGVKSYISKGKPFDPHLHEAVETEESSDVPPGIVLEEFLKGYEMGGQPIRPARVKVSKAPESPEEQSE